MGLLDDLLNNMLAGQSAGAPPANRAPQPQAPSGGSDMTRILMSLLPVVMAMMANRGGGTAQQPRGGSTGGGGLGDLLGSLLGGGRGGSAGGGGGLGDLLSQLQRAGLGTQANSWVSRGQNQPISPDAMEQVFGRDGLSQLARYAGISEAEAARGMSQLLPEVVDRVTPDGRVPDQNELAASVDAFTKRYGMR